LGGTTRFEAYDEAGTCCTTKTATSTLMSIEVAHPERGWHERRPYPGAKRWLPATVTDGKSIWMLGGFYQESAKDPLTTFADVLRYDIKREQWALLAPLPKAVKDAQPLTALWVRNRILVFTFARSVWQLDPATSTYSEVSPLPEKVSVDRFVLIGDHIVGASGENDPEGPHRRSEWTFIGTLNRAVGRRQLHSSK
jgi:Kelch motif protein